MFHLIPFLCLAFYFLPSIAAHNKRNFAAIFTLNLLLGWTVIGWVVALVWALTADPPAYAVPAQPTCSACRTPIGAGQNFCSHCGSRLAWPQGGAPGTPNIAR